MIPWVEAGPAIQFADGGKWSWFQLLFLVGWVVGAALTRWQGWALGLREEWFGRLTVLAALAGLVGAHLYAVLLIHPETLWGYPCDPGTLCVLTDEVCVQGARCGGRWGVLLELFNGQMTAGAEFSVVAVWAGWWIFFGRRQPVEQQLAVAWSMSLMMVFAFWLSSIGCYMANDHVSRPLNWVIATAYPDGALPGVPGVPGFGEPGHTNRVNMGFAHFAVLSMFGVIPLTRALVRRRWSLAFSLGLVLVFYGGARMTSAYFYATDIADPEPRWFGFGDWPGFHTDFFVAMVTLLLSLPLWRLVVQQKTVWEQTT